MECSIVLPTGRTVTSIEVLFVGQDPNLGRFTSLRSCLIRAQYGPFFQRGSELEDVFFPETGADV